MMTLITNDQIEGADRNIELGSIFVQLFVTSSKDGVLCEQIDRHSLDRADVHKGVARLRVRLV